MAKAPEPRREIARLQERMSGGIGCRLMLILGAIAFVLVAFNDNSAIRLAAWAAIWTGWNVIWAAGLLIEVKRTYVITREDDGGQ